MKKIKDGEFIITKDGYIGKIIRHICNDPCFYNMPYYEVDILYRMPGCYLSFNIYQDMIKKHSFELIDLIKTGDYVNGKQVEHVRDGFIIFKGVGCTVYSSTIYKDEIRSVLTKEIFEKMEYKIN